jgi:1-acyl-sn-glycerol-3-phosphate acyltransferase
MPGNPGEQESTRFARKFVSDRTVPMTDPSFLLSMINCAETFRVCFPTVVDAGLGRLTRGQCDDRLDAWSRRVVAHVEPRLHVVGREHHDSKSSFIVMSNHQSLYDVPVLFQALGPNLRMVAKHELFWIPVFGGALREAGFVSIDRSKREEARESLARARELLASGVSVWIAPEGTRSRDGSLLPMKMGGFHLALETGWPILPVSLDGTRAILPAKAASSVRGAAVTVTVHAPIDPTTYGSNVPEARRALADAVRSALASGLPRS